MPQAAFHPPKSIQVPLRNLSPIEDYVPRLLQEFLRDLNLAQDVQTVWTLLETLCETVGQRYIIYRFGSRLPSGEARHHRRSNLPSDWVAWVDSLPDGSALDYGLNHTSRKLTPFAVGIEFAEQYRQAGFLSPQYEAQMKEAAEIGWRSGLLIPLRSTRREERGSFIICGGLSEPRFRAFMAEHGWTIEVAAIQAHMKYISLLLREEAESYDLTKRQLEFLRLSANGYEIKEIAFDWDVSVQYVTRVRRQVCDRLGVKSKMAVMVKAVRLDLLTEDDFEIGHAMSSSWI